MAQVINTLRASAQKLAVCAVFAIVAGGCAAAERNCDGGSIRTVLWRDTAGRFRVTVRCIRAGAPAETWFEGSASERGGGTCGNGD